MLSYPSNINNDPIIKSMKKNIISNKLYLIGNIDISHIKCYLYHGLIEPITKHFIISETENEYSLSKAKFCICKDPDDVNEIIPILKNCIEQLNNERSGITI